MFVHICAYQEVRNVSFSENFAYVFNEYPLVYVSHIDHGKHHHSDQPIIKTDLCYISKSSLSKVFYRIYVQDLFLKLTGKYLGRSFFNKFAG